MDNKNIHADVNNIRIATRIMIIPMKTMMMMVMMMIMTRTQQV